MSDLGVVQSLTGRFLLRMQDYGFVPGNVEGRCYIDLSDSVSASAAIEIMDFRGEGAWGAMVVLSLYFHDIASLVARLRGRRYRPGRVATLGVPLSTACPHVQGVSESMFSDVEDGRREMDRQAYHAGTCGRQFLESHATPVDLIEWVGDSPEFDWGARSYNLPIIYQAAGYPDRAQRLVRRWLAELGDRSDQATMIYRSYMQRVAAEFSWDDWIDIRS